MKRMYRVMRMRRMRPAAENFHCFYILTTAALVLQVGPARLALFTGFDDNRKMQETEDKILHDFGKRVQRCFGCFVAYHLKDMYLGEDASFFCEHCKDESMFAFSEFSKAVEVGKLREAADTEHDHHP